MTTKVTCQLRQVDLQQQPSTAFRNPTPAPIDQEVTEDLTRLGLFITLSLFQLHLSLFGQHSLRGHMAPVFSFDKWA